MRDHHAGGPTGEVVVERLERLLRPHTALAIELPQTLFRFGVERQHGVAGVEVLGFQDGDALELRIAVWRLASGQHLGHLVQRQTFLFQPGADDLRADRRPQRGHLLGQLVWRKLGPHRGLFIRVTRRAHLKHRLQIPFELWLSFDLFFDRRRVAALVPQRGRWAVGPTRSPPVRWCALNSPTLRQRRIRHHGPVSAPRRPHRAVDPSRTTSDRSPASALRHHAHSVL